jgi:membrane protease YdiL (CAAX protease family)
MSERFDSAVTNPATWSDARAKGLAGHEWIESAGKVVLILAILIPLLVILASRPRQLAHVSTYALLVGGLGAILFTIALGVRASTYQEMHVARKGMYIFQWIIYSLMIVASGVLIAVKYAYSIPIVERDERHRDFIVGFLY